MSGSTSRGRRGRASARKDYLHASASESRSRSSDSSERELVEEKDAKKKDRKRGSSARRHGENVYYV